jgi:hypothetical protein
MDDIRLMDDFPVTVKHPITHLQFISGHTYQPLDELQRLLMRWIKYQHVPVIDR